MTVSGDATIFVCGRPLLGNCDPPETLTSAFDPVTGGYLGEFHSSPPTTNGEYGVRFWPENLSYRHALSDYPIDRSHGWTNISGVPVARPLYYNEPYTNPNQTKIGEPSGFMMDLYEGMVNSPPGSLVLASPDTYGFGPAYYVTHAGGVFPEPANQYFVGNAPDATVNPAGLCTKMGIKPGQSPVYDCDITINNWANLPSLPCTLFTNSTANVNPGTYLSYIQATDLYPIYVHCVGPYLFYYVTDMAFTNVRDIALYFDLCYLAAGDADLPGHIVDANKVLHASLILATPDGTRTPHPYLAWDSIIYAATGVFYPGRGNPPANPVIQDPIPTFDFNHSFTEPDFYGCHVGMRRLFATNQGSTYYTVSSGSVTGRIGPPVPAPVTDLAVGDATFSLQPRIQATVHFDPLLYTDGGTLAGAQVELRVEFDDGSHYDLINATTDMNGFIAPANTDYWMGSQNSPNLPANLLGLHLIVTVPDGVSSLGFQTFHEVVESVYETGIPIRSTDGSHRYYVILGSNAIAAQPVVHGNWTCSQPDITIYDITIIAYTPVPIQASAQITQNARKITEVVSQTSGSPYITFAGTVDAGHTFATTYTIPAPGNAYCPSLLVHTKSNAHRVIYTDGTALYRMDAKGAAQSAADWGTPILMGLSYTLPCAVSHTKQGWDYILMSAVRVSDGLTLDILQSGDGGQTWAVINAAMCSIKPHLGRPVLAWMAGGLVFLAASQGTALTVSKSLDGGHTWAVAVNAITSPSFNDITEPALYVSDGVLYAACLVKRNAMLSISRDLGKTWSNPVSIPTASAFALGQDVKSGRLLLGTTHHSIDSGASWQDN